MHFSVPIIGGLKPGIRHPVVPVVLKRRLTLAKSIPEISLIALEKFSFQSSRNRDLIFFYQGKLCVTYKRTQFILVVPIRQSLSSLALISERLRWIKSIETKLSCKQFANGASTPLRRSYWSL